MNTLQLTITEHLKAYHRGKANAIHFHALAEYFDLNERELRDIVSGIIKSGYAPLCSISSGNGGYFFPETEEEFNHADAEDSSRIKELAIKKRGRKRAWRDYKQEYREVKQLQFI